VIVTAAVAAAALIWGPRVIAAAINAPKLPANFPLMEELSASAPPLAAPAAAVVVAGRQAAGRVNCARFGGRKQRKPSSIIQRQCNCFNTCDDSVPFSALESAAARGADAALWADLRGNMAGMFWQFYVADDIQ
jgi:hypothetical protein